VPNELNRYSLGTKNKTLKTSPDGSLTFTCRLMRRLRRSATTGLPAPKGADFSLLHAHLLAEGRGDRRFIGRHGRFNGELVDPMSGLDIFAWIVLLILIARAVR